MKTLTTRILLPPGRMSSSRVQETVQIITEKFRWFEPRRYGFAALDGKIEPGLANMEELLAYYQRMNALCIGARTDRDFVLIGPARTEEYPYVGDITWRTPARVASQASWRATHATQVAELMARLNSPLAFAALHEDVDRKTRRLVDRGDHQERGFTVRGYDEGLAGLFWRNFYGPPFVRLLGEKLESLPPECRTRLGEQLVLVQPYELPTEAGTESAVARERALIEALGPECFYDHEHHRLPTRRPVLDDLPGLTSPEDPG